MCVEKILVSPKFYKYKLLSVSLSVVWFANQLNLSKLINYIEHTCKYMGFKKNISKS